MKQINLNSNQKEFLAYFKNGWQLTETLFSGIKDDSSFYLRPYHKLRHPLIFYYTHPAVFYINKLRVAGLLKKPLNSHFEELFEVGVDEMSWDDLHEEKKNIWPKLDEVKAYRKKVFEIVCDLIQSHSFKTPINQKSPFWALVMAFEHERIHLETSSVLIRELPIQLVKKPKKWPEFLISKKPASNQMIKVEFREVKLGKPADFPTFGWDNEYGSEKRQVSSFLASKFLISNGEFLEFVKDGGYIKEEYWSKDGWNWRKFNNSKWPTFWVQDGPGGSHLYKLRTIFEIIPFESNLPACVNFYEAKAYCAWKSKKDQTSVPYRLLTEAEHNAIRDQEIGTANLDLISGGESSVNYFKANSKGFYDVFGNVWQWCEDVFHPLKDFKVHPFYEDFSSPCFDGKHQMMLGGSFISTGDEASKWARFHFRPHFFQHLGFRIVLGKKASTYETEEMLNKYLLMHFGSDKEIGAKNLAKIVNLPLKCADLVTKYSSKFDNVLDLGCSVGGSSFELAKSFKKVWGIDYSQEFIRVANILKEKGSLDYLRKDSGDISTKLTAKIDPKINRKKISFKQGDACNLPNNLKNFDAVLLSNTLCRLPDPKSCLDKIQNDLLKKGGVLVMTTPFSWLEEYTPKSNWLNGINEVKKILNKCELIHQEELPFLIRDHERRFELIITLATIWKRI